MTFTLYYCTYEKKSAPALYTFSLDRIKMLNIKNVHISKLVLAQNLAKMNDKQRNIYITRTNILETLSQGLKLQRKSCHISLSNIWIISNNSNPYCYYTPPCFSYVIIIPKIEGLFFQKHCTLYFKDLIMHRTCIRNSTPVET